MRASDTTALKMLLDHYAAVDSLLHVAERPPFHGHVEGDALLVDLPLEGGRRNLSRLLEQRYAVLYEGRAPGLTQRLARNVAMRDSAFLAAVATLLRGGLARHDAAFAALQGDEARKLVLRLKAAELASVERLLEIHPSRPR